MKFEDIKLNKVVWRVIEYDGYLFIIKGIIVTFSTAYTPVEYNEIKVKWVFGAPLPVLEAFDYSYYANQLAESKDEAIKQYEAGIAAELQKRSEQIDTAFEKNEPIQWYDEFERADWEY